jgi:hypothetical protein
VKALVSTSEYVLYVDCGTGLVKVIESQRRNYYGISWWGNSEYPVLSHSQAPVNLLETMEDYVNSDRGYLSFGDEKTQDFLSCPHQILCAPNGWVVAANTGKNRVTIYKADKQFYKDIRLNEIDWDRKGRNALCGEHINSVYLKNDRLYVLAHAFKNQSYVLEYSFPEIQLLGRHDVNNRSGCHNIFIDASGNYITCDSERGQLVDIRTNEVIWSDPGCYLRGLAATSEVYIIGDSEIVSRNARISSQTGLWLVDRKKLKTLDFIPLGQYGACNEVRVLDVPDEAHHGRRFINMSLFDEFSEVTRTTTDADILFRRRKERLKKQASQTT